MSDVRKIREKSLRLQTYKIQILHRETGRKKDMRMILKYEVRSMNFKFEFLPSNFLLRKLCGTLWLNLAGLVDDYIIICFRKIWVLCHFFA
jgi:hypothetical protein